MEGLAARIDRCGVVDAGKLTADFLNRYVYIHYTLRPLRPTDIGTSTDHLRRKEVNAMPGCCGTTEKEEPKTQQEEQKAEEKENPYASSCEVGQCCG